MQPTDRVQFMKVMNGMATMKKTMLSTDALDLWWMCMAAWAVEDFTQAAAHLLTKCEFMPTPKDFEDLRKAGRPSAGEAWARVLDAVRKGSWRWEGSQRELRKDFLPPEDALTTSAVAAIGGYAAIAMHEERTLHFLERRFAEHYDAIRDRQEIREALPQIAKRPDWLQLQMEQARKKLTQQ